MKANTPSLILFFAASAFVIVFKMMQYDSLMLYAKAVLIPSLFIYYFVSNNYKITPYKLLIFFLFFVRDIFNTLLIKESALGAFLCVLIVYIMLFKLSYKDFKYIKFNFRDGLSLFVLIVAVSAICFSVLNLKLENLELDFPFYVFFGIVLSVLSIVSITNYTKNGTYAFFYSMMMCVCFIVTDIFFILYKFYFYNYVFTLISIITQVLSYFFMVNYFLEKDKFKEDTINF